MAKYVIIGNSVAGIGGVEGIRSADPDGQITLIADEPYHTYSRPLISYYLAGKVNDARMAYRPKGYYQKMRVTPMLGKRVVSLDTVRRQVETDDGAKIGFDKLLVATGGVPFMPKIEGARAGTCFTFTKWDDAKAIKALVAARPARVSRAVVIGGGLIGIKAAEALNELGVKVTIVEVAPAILSTALDATGSKMMQAATQDAGIEVVLGNTVTGIGARGDTVTGVTLKDGKSLECDLVVVAIGVVPNVSIVKGTAVSVNRGILVNDHLETAVSGVYAAGDVSEGLDALHGAKRVVPIWPNAYRQGKIAGRNMAGAVETHTGSFAMNSVEINHLPSISVGLTNLSGDGVETLVRKDLRRRWYRKIVLQDDLIVGAVFVNGIDRAGIICGLIRDRINVKNFKQSLLDDNFGYISLPRKLRRERLETLGAKQW